MADEQTEEQAARDIERKALLVSLAGHRFTLDDIANAAGQPMEVRTQALVGLAILDALALVCVKLDDVMSEPAVLQMEVVDSNAEAQRQEQEREKSEAEAKEARGDGLRAYGWIQVPSGLWYDRAGGSTRSPITFEEAWRRHEQRQKAMAKHFEGGGDGGG